MWCCSQSAKFLFDSVINFGGESINVNGENGRVSSGSGGESSGSSGTGSSFKREVSIDSGYVGHEVVVIKNGLRICGTGGALGSAPLVQTKSFFEVKIQQEGKWGVGLSTRDTILDEGPLGKDIYSWILRETGELFHNGQCIGKLEPTPTEGDIIGVSYDHIELSFYVNGEKRNITFANVRGTVYPALYVHEGAVLDAIFEGFLYPMPSGFEKIMKEKSIL